MLEKRIAVSDPHSSSRTFQWFNGNLTADVMPSPLDDIWHSCLSGCRDSPRLDLGVRLQGLRGATRWSWRWKIRDAKSHFNSNAEIIRRELFKQVCGIMALRLHRVPGEFWKVTQSCWNPRCRPALHSGYFSTAASFAAVSVRPIKISRIETGYVQTLHWTPRRNGAFSFLQPF